MMNKPARQQGRVSAELEQRLEAYARARLSASAEATAKVRAEVLNEARRRLAEPPALVPFALDRRRRIRWAPALLAAVLVLALAVPATFAGSRVGGALYPVRLWLEDATLPGDSAARFDALLGHLQARVDDAASASASGNGAAVSAALQAYWTTVESALVAAGSDLDREARLALVLERHVVVLNTLAIGVPDQARPAINRAIERASDKIDQIKQAQPGTHGPTGPGGPSGGPPSDRPGANPPAAQPNDLPGAPPSHAPKRP